MDKQTANEKPTKGESEIKEGQRVTTPAPRSTTVTVKERVYEIYRLRLQGKDFLELVEHARKNQWGVTESAIRYYITKANKLCERLYDRKATHLHAQHCLQRRLLLERCLSQGDYRTALAVLQDEAALVGLYPAKKSEIKQEHTLAPTGDGPAVSDPETMRLAYEFAKRASGGDGCGPAAGVPNGPASVGDGSEPGAVSAAPAPDVSVPEADAGS